MRTAKERPGRLNFGSPGVGTPPHLWGEIFKSVAGIDVSHVPYQGGAQAVADLMAGNTHLEIDGLAFLLPLIQSGRLRALATSGHARIDALPQVPTFAEAGYPIDFPPGFMALAVPAHSRADRRAPAPRPSNQPAHSRGEAHFKEGAMTLSAELPEELATALRTEHAAVGKAIRAANIRLQ